MIKKIIAALGLGFAGYVLWEYYRVDGDYSFNGETGRDSGYLGGFVNAAFGAVENIGGVVMGGAIENQNLMPSFELLNFLKGYERLELKPYYATPNEAARGIQTIGYGHVIKSNEDFSAGISRADAEVLFAKDVASHAEQIYSQIKVPLTQNQFDALVSFCFNLGANCLKTVAKGMRDRVNSGDYDSAANAFMLYVKQKNKNGGYDVIQGLYNRRYSEMRIFKFGIYERFNG